MSPTLAAQRARRVLYAFIAVGTAVLVTGAVIGFGILVDLTREVRNTQLEGTPTGKKLVASADRILDCTDPGDPETGRPPGECYSDNQERTAQVLGDINRLIVASAACAAGVNPEWTVERREAAITTCVVDRLAMEAARNGKP